MLKKLPQTVKDAILSVNTSEANWKIGQKHSLHIDKIGELGSEVGFVMMGITRREQFIPNLKKRLNIDDAKAAAITEDVNREIFEKIRVYIKTSTPKPERTDIVPPKAPITEPKVEIQQRPEMHLAAVPPITVTKESNPRVSMIDTPVLKPKLETKTEERTSELNSQMLKALAFSASKADKSEKPEIKVKEVMPENTVSGNSFTTDLSDRFVGQAVDGKPLELAKKKSAAWEKVRPLSKPETDANRAKEALVFTPKENQQKNNLSRKMEPPLPPPPLPPKPPPAPPAKVQRKMPYSTLGQYSELKKSHEQVQNESQNESLDRKKLLSEIENPNILKNQQQKETSEPPSNLPIGTTSPKPPSLSLPSTPPQDFTPPKQEKKSDPYREPVE